MVRRNLNKYVIALVLTSMLFGSYGFACNSGNTNKDSTFKTLVRTEDDIAQGLKSAASVLKSSKEAGAISQEDIEFLKPILDTVATSNLEAIKVARFIDPNGEFPLDKKQQLLSIVSFAADQLVLLNNEGALRIKNPQKRLLFNTIVITLQASVTSLVPLLTKGK